MAPARRFWLAWGTAAAAWIALLALLSPYDRDISRAIMDRSSEFGLAIFHFGEAPGWLGVVFALCLLGVAHAPKGLGRSSRLAALESLGWHVLCQALVHPLILTQALKFLWGRVRPFHCGADFAAFTPFWRPAGPGAGESFPSGHVAMAVVAAPLVFWLWRRGRRGAALLALGLLAAFGALVAVGRVVAGSHFATDAWFSLGLGFLLAALWGRGRAQAPSLPG